MTLSDAPLNQHPLGDDDAEYPTVRIPTPPVEDMVSPRGKALVSLAAAKGRCKGLLIELDMLEGALISQRPLKHVNALVALAHRELAGVMASLTAYTNKLEGGQ